ncbi:hypothetical protein BS78_03G169800 [Paspalum vaginatum]|nr:hypothetical protein BS78_03G169800 [Paspalum vaginatum]
MRAQLMMRNNRKLQSLGVTALASIMNNNAQNIKPSASKDLDPLYNPRDDDEYMAEDIPDKESDNTATRINVSTVGAATRLTKRVLAPQEQDQIARVTRRRTRELSATNEEGGIGTTTNEQEGFIEAALVSANCPTQLKDQNQMGNRRHEAPIQAAKLATEGGIILRQHVPILPHRKEYKKDKDIFEVYICRGHHTFTIDKKSSVVRDACMDLMKRGQRQMRHKLKKQYFDDIPANQVRITSPIDTMTDEQWIKLVETWSTPRHKETCRKSKTSHQEVVYQQKIGSRCYIAHAHMAKQAKYKDEPPIAIDLFKECHYSKKNGFTEPINKAIADMEAIVAEAVDGQVPKTPAEAISQVLPKTKFLSNVGLQSVAPKRNAKSAARVQELELELQAEKQGALDLRGTLDEQQEQADEIASLKKGQEETNMLLRRLLSLSTQAQSRI